MLLTIIAALLLLIWIAKKFIAKLPEGMPPGPKFKLPVIGSAFYLGTNPVKSVANLRKE